MSYLEDLKKVAEEATRFKPWRYKVLNSDQSTIYPTGLGVIHTDGWDERDNPTCDATKEYDADGKFIAQANPATVLWLIEMIDQAFECRSEEKLQELLDKLDKGPCKEEK